ncbi:hypothetical protein EYF80_020161 [Liparis tanakae]|uniref:Uncharacterized protein n=1 Tax=Liparis tanakae TaxID=230148 RepID=A0A4Z2HVQ3_9TELE|nr:hypothetical protein EYF80_020161 [Liparis tanakae]
MLSLPIRPLMGVTGTRRHDTSKPSKSRRARDATGLTLSVNTTPSFQTWYFMSMELNLHETSHG